MAGLSTGAGAPVVKVYHEKSMILPDVSRVLACLYEKDVKFETVKDSYKDILRLQATRSVPVPFCDGPTFLQESRAICRYIAETYQQRGYPFLLGKDVLERASIEQWLRHEEHAFDPPSRALFCHLAFPLHDEGIDDIDREKRKLEEVLEVYEQRLGESEFLAGNKFTLADLVHLPNTHHIVTSEKFAYLYDSRKNVQRWWNAISARDSWQQVVRDMKSVEEQHQREEEFEQHQWEEFEQHQWEEFEQQQQQQWEPLPTSGGRSIRIDPRKQAGTDSQTILVPPPSGGIISSSFFTVPQEEQPLPAETTSHGEPPAIERKESNFFAAPERTPPPSEQRTSTTHKSPSNVQGTTSNFFTPATLPTTNKKPQRTDTDKSTSKDASSPTRPSQRSSKEAPNKLHVSDFYRANNHTDEAEPITKPTPREASKTSDRISEARQTGEALAPDKPSPGSVKAPHEITPDKPTQKSPSSVQSPTRTFFTPATPPTTSKMPQRTNTDKSTSKDVQGEPAPQARQRDAKDITKEAREADQKRATSAPTRELPSGSQNIPQQSKAPPTDLKVSDLSPLQAEYEDTKGAMDGDEQFSTKRLRKMLEQSDAEALKPQSTDLQAPPKQDETPSIYKKPSYVQDRKGQAGNISADEKTDGTPSTGTRAPDTPTSADERRATSPPKEGMAPDDRGATEPRKSPSINEQQPAPPVPSQSPTTGAWRASASSNGAAQDDDLAHLSTIDQWQHASTPPPIQQGAPGGSSIDKLDKTADVGRRAQQSTPKKTSTEQSDKSAMYERAPAVAPRQAPPSDTRRTSASTPPSQESVSSSQQTTESIKGVTPTLHGITGDESDNIAMADENATPPAPPASYGRSVTTALQGGVLDARGENEAVKPSVADPRGMPTTPKRPAATPDNQRHTTSDQVSDQAPPLSSFSDTRNARAGIAEADETITMAPDEQPVGRAPKNAGAPAAGPLPMRSQKNMNEAYSDGASIQQLSSDQSRAQPAENKKKQGGDATLVTEFDKSKEKGFLANANQNNTEQAEATSAAGPSKKQIHSDQNQPISSKDVVQDIGKQTNETVYYRSSATSREMLPSAPKKSMREQQLQGDKSSISPQDNGQQGSEAALPVSETEQPKERELLTAAGPSKKQIHSDQNQPISSKDVVQDIGKQTNETVYYRSSATSREMLPSAPKKSMREQQLQGDKSSISPQDNGQQGSEAVLPVSETEQPKERELLTAAGPSKKQIHSDQNQPISSKDVVQDIGKQTNETVYYRSSATSREMLPSAPKKSMREQQLQGDKSSISPQDNGQQGSEAALPVSETEQPKERELLTNADRNSGKTPGQALQESEEQTSPDTQQVKNNGSNIKSDGSSKPTQFDGNEDDVPESQRGGSSTNL